MSVAVVAFKSYCLRTPQAGEQRYEEHVIARITGANTDVDYDIGDTSAGAFWTAAEADSTYGAVATALKNHLIAVQGAVGTYPCSHIQSPILGVSHALTPATPSANSHLQIVKYTSGIPEIAFNSGGAPTDWLLHIIVPLAANADAQSPLSFGSGL